MDLLQKELQRKKKALERAKQEAAIDDGNKDDTKKKSGSSSSKFLRVGDLRRIQEEQEEEERRMQKEKQKQEQEMLLKQLRKRRFDGSTGEQQAGNKDDSTNSEQATKAKKRKKKKKRRVEGESGIDKESSPGRGNGEQKVEEEGSKNASRSTSSATSERAENEMIAEFRQLGLPIRLFGETHKERVGRLQKALQEKNKYLQGASEMDEFRLGRGHGIRNPFLEKDKDDDTSNQHSKAGQDDTKSGGTSKQETTGDGSARVGVGDDAAAVDEGDEYGDHHNDHPKRIYHFFKGLLKQWEEDLSLRPDSVKRSVAGKNESKTVKQCKDYIRPLFKLCKTRRLEPGMEAHLIKIVNFAQQGEFVSAHDAYIDVAIGRAAWPIGVTMVGIHARSGRAKIESANVAHVMNSELQRKYLTSVKRLLTYAQKKREDVDPSKKVL